MLEIDQVLHLHLHADAQRHPVVVETVLAQADDPAAFRPVAGLLAGSVAECADAAARMKVRSGLVQAGHRRAGRRADWARRHH